MEIKKVIVFHLGMKSLCPCSNLNGVKIPNIKLFSISLALRKTQRIQIQTQTKGENLKLYILRAI